MRRKGGKPVDWGYALAKGVIQGLAEFLPVSSTAHLLLFDALAERFGFVVATGNPRVEEFFDILLHIGTLVAVLAYFRRDWLVLLRVSTGRGLPSGFIAPWDYPTLLKGLLISFVTTSVLVLGTVKGTEFLFSTMGWSRPGVADLSELFMVWPGFVILHLCVTGGLLWWAESQLAHQPPLHGAVSVDPTQALRVGVFQSIAAVFHGISRSGSTMTAGILNGWDRPTAAKYSFLLSLPTFLAALLYEFTKVIRHVELASLPWPVMLTATAVSAVVGYGCIATFIPYLTSHSLRGFSVYCWTVAVVLTGVFWLS